MTPERLKKIREWDATTSNRDGAQEHRRELLAEVDRLASKLAVAVEALTKVSTEGDCPTCDRPGPLLRDASKPLVEGFKVGDLVCTARDYGYTWQSNFWVTPDNVEHVTANAHRYRRVEPEPGQVYPGPSAKADEGKAQFNKCSACGGTKIVPGANEYTTEACRECFDGMVPAQPAPPALTREEVAEMFAIAFTTWVRSWQDLRAVDGIRAALKEAP